MRGAALGFIRTLVCVSVGLLLLVGWCWAAPCTLLCFAVAKRKGVSYYDVKPLGFRFIANYPGKLWRWLDDNRVDAITFGTLTIYRDVQFLKTLQVHEETHALQAMIFGPVLPLVLALDALHGRRTGERLLERWADARRRP